MKTSSTSRWGQYAGAAVAAAGAGLAFGYLRSRRHRDTRDALGGSRGVLVEERVTIDRPAQELYQFWRNLENLPRVMRHLDAVTDLGGGRSHWVAVAHGLGRYEWDAEVINDVPGRLIAWRSLPASDVMSAGSVHFEEDPSGRGTRVSVRLQYDPPAGKLGALVAGAFGEDAQQQIHEDLQRLRRALEAGEIPLRS